MLRRFTVLVERDPDSNWLIGEVVELPGCYTQAPDINALEENIKEAIGAYLSASDGDNAEDVLPIYVGTLNIEVDIEVEAGV